jgi:peptide/nickel transport system substrate-binding protein
MGITKLCAITIVSLVGALFVSACGGGTQAPPRASNGVVAMDISGPVTTYDPVKAVSLQDLTVAWTLYDPLINFDTNGKLIPGLAESWQTTKKGMVFTLRTGVTCSDGTKLTPAVAAASLRRYLDPKKGSPLLAFVIGPNNRATITSDDKTLSITLQKPWADLAKGLALAPAGIVCSAGTNNPKMLRTGSDGTGAFVAKSQRPGSSYTFTRRAGYNWGSRFTGAPSGALPKQLVLKVVTDENTRANLAQTGALQIAHFTSAAGARVAKSNDVATKVSQKLDTLLIPNQKNGLPASDPRIRKAIFQAVDRKALNQVMGFGHGKVLENLGQPDTQCYDGQLGSDLVAYDPEAAKKVLKGVRLRILGTTFVANGDGNRYLLNALKAAGANVSMELLDNGAWLTRVTDGKNDWDMTLYSFSNLNYSYLLAGTFVAGGAPPNGFNVGNIGNPTAQAAFERAGQLSGSAQCEKLTAFQRALFAQDDVLPISSVPTEITFAGGTSAAVTKGNTIPQTIRLSK